MANPVITAQKVTTDYHYVPCENDELLDLRVARDEKDYAEQVKIRSWTYFWNKIKFLAILLIS